LQEAANQGDMRAIAWGIGALVLTIVALDQLIWRPLIAWSDRFKLQLVESENPPTSWFYDALRSSRFFQGLMNFLFRAPLQATDEWLLRHFPATDQVSGAKRLPWFWYLLGIAAGAGLAFLVYQAGLMLWTVPLGQWMGIGLGVLATLGRVMVALFIALAWTLPLGVAIGTNQRLANWLQPVVQIGASVPATALFPVLLLFVLGLPGGINLAAVLLMLLGTQWYLLFNIIAGASAIPQHLKYTATLLQLGPWERWRTLILPALFPYAITGAITAVGGAWNASIVAEYTSSAATPTRPSASAPPSQPPGRGITPALAAAPACFYRGRINWLLAASIVWLKPIIGWNELWQWTALLELRNINQVYGSGIKVRQPGQLVCWSGSLPP
jgi:NitT/TauT family transport system permease protein